MLSLAAKSRIALLTAPILSQIAVLFGFQFKLSGKDSSLDLEKLIRKRFHDRIWVVLEDGVVVSTFSSLRANEIQGFPLAGKLSGGLRRKPVPAPDQSATVRNGSGR